MSGSVRPCLMVLKEVFSAHRGCIYWIKNTVKMCDIITIYNNCFLCEYLLKCNLFLWSKLYFQHHYSSLQCHMIFRNHYNILIYCSRNISDYYQWKKLFCCFIILRKVWYVLCFSTDESSKEQHLFEMEIFCDIINALLLLLINLMHPWLIKVFICSKKSYWPQQCNDM